MKTGVTVFDIMTKNPICISPESNLKKAAELMLKKKVGGLVVTKNNNLVGIITEKDLVRIVAKGKNPEKILVKDTMNKRVRVIAPKEDIYDAILRMRKKDVRRLPVLDKKRLIGLLTVKDILRIQPGLFDLFVEKFQIRELKQKRSGAGKYLEGECEICGNYAQLIDTNDKLVCEGCRDLE